MKNFIENLKIKSRKDYKSKSKNDKVVKLYIQILKWTSSDFENGTIDFGKVRREYNSLTFRTIRDIKEDFENWTLLQKEQLIAILRHCKRRQELFVFTLKTTYPEKWKTQSVNKAVLNVYGMVVYFKEPKNDWVLKINAQKEVLDILYKDFNLRAWEKLEKDMFHWTNQQLEMFGEYILLRGYSYSDDSKEYKSTILQRFNLAITLSHISTQRGKFDSEIFNVLHNYIKYFIVFFDYICQQDSSYLDKMRELREYLEPTKYEYPEFTEVQKKIEEYNG